MKTMRIPLIILGCAFSLLIQAQTTHWNCDPYAYQYDMAVYFSLIVNGEAVGNMSDYEVAAFVGDECRGVAKVQTVGNTQYGYIRIRSNEAEGETVTFKVFDIDKQKETDVEDVSIPFRTDATIGLPSSPLALSIVTYICGDANSDGLVNVSDVMTIRAYILGKTVTSFNEQAADLTGDGRIAVDDVQKLWYIILNQP